MDHGAVWKWSGADYVPRLCVECEFKYEEEYEMNRLTVRSKGGRFMNRYER